MTSKRFLLPALLAAALLVCARPAPAQPPADPAKYIREHFTKAEHKIPARDGVKLFTAVYSPKDISKKYPILMMRTPYSVGPYGTDVYRRDLGPSRAFLNQ